MKAFKDRKKKFEEKFAKDMDLQFKVECRACKQFGLWIAEMTGLSGDEANVYAMEIVTANLEKPGFDDVLERVRRDIDEKKVEISDHKLRFKLETLMEECKEALMEDTSL
jgi:hypothetical protein